MSVDLKSFSFSPRAKAPRIEITIGDRILETDFLKEQCRLSKKRIALIADISMRALAEKLKKSLSAELFIFEGGEISKTREIKQQLEDSLLKKGFGKDTLLLAIGGGVTTDLVSFLASTYMRGISLILIPTTLLAMVDAAIGGKTGVDTPFGKNLIGSFYHPQSICIDTNLLSSLPQTEWKNGLAEILKYALIGDPSLWNYCEKHIDDWQKKDVLSHLIHSSIQMKMAIVEKDPEEQGFRRILNFGHTVGHALELISHFQIPHGIAVAIGLQAESYLSHHLGYLSEKELKTILHLFKQFEFPLSLPKAFPKQQFFKTMRLDKKSKNGEPRFVLLERIGHPLSFEGSYCRSMTPTDCDALAKWLELSHG